MAKVTYEQYAGVLEKMSRSYFYKLESVFSYMEEGEVIPVSKGGFQKEIRFGLKAHHSFGMVARLGKPSTDKEAPVTLEVYVRVRQDGKWRDFYDGILTPQYVSQARMIAKASVPMIEEMRTLLEGTEVVFIDNTHLPLENWNTIRKSSDEIKRCKRLYSLIHM